MCKMKVGQYIIGRLRKLEFHFFYNSSLQRIYNTNRYNNNNQPSSSASESDVAAHRAH